MCEQIIILYDNYYNYYIDYIHWNIILVLRFALDIIYYNYMNIEYAKCTVIHGIMIIICFKYLNSNI